MDTKKTLRILIYDKLDDQGHAIPGERRALAGFSDEQAQQQFVEDAKLERERIKLDFFECDTFDLPETAQPNHICFALYKKWARDGAFELSGYSYTRSFEDTATGYDKFVMPILVDKSHEEMEAWKDAAMRARLGSGKTFRAAKRALAKLPAQEREKREAEFLTDFAQNAYKVFKPKTQREAVAIKSAIALGLIWVAVMFLFIPEEPSLAENAGSVPWLPDASNISYFRSPEVIVFECQVPWQRAQIYIPAEYKPVRDTEFMRYNLYMPNANPEPMQGLEMSSEEFEEWNAFFKAQIKDGYEATFSDGSRLVYDTTNGMLYGFLIGDTRDLF